MTTSKKALRCPVCKKAKVKTAGALCINCVVVVSVATLLLLFVGVGMLSKLQNMDIGKGILTSVSSVLPKGKITGAAWLTKKAGQSDIQRGMEIALCNESASADIAQAIGGQDTTDYEFFNINLGSIDRAAAKDAVKGAKTDVDGKYVLTDIPPGNYYLFASYNTDLSCAYWLVPVTVGAGQEQSINLDNSNMSAVANKSSSYSSY